MKLKKITMLWMVVIVLSLTATAQDDYVVGPRDELQVEVQGEESMTQKGIVSPEGTITYWVLGQIKVGGLSVQQIQTLLTKVLSQGYLRTPIVKVTVTQYRSKEVQIQGAVQKPGTYTLESNSVTLLKLISMASGCTDNRGPVAYIVRGGKELEELKKDAPETQLDSLQKEVAAMENRIEVDLDRLLVQGDVTMDKPIYGGDYVLIASTTSMSASSLIWIEGQVKTPGSISFRPGLTALKACLQAGGFTDAAAPNRATITRQNGDKSETIHIQLKDISKNKKPDVPLQPGDRITIPEGVF